MAERFIRVKRYDSDGTTNVLFEGHLGGTRAELVETPDGAELQLRPAAPAKPVRKAAPRKPAARKTPAKKSTARKR